MALRAVLTVAALAAALPRTVAKKGKHRGEGWRLGHHSFSTTLSYDDTLGDWLSSASTMALRDRVQLLPPVPSRWGVLWDTKAVNTKDFDVKFGLSCNPLEGADPKDAIVAFWISPDNFSASYNEQAIVLASKDWTKGSEASGFTFIQNKPAFHGFAMVFAGRDRHHSQRQSITGFWNDGTKTLNSVDDLLAAPGAQVKFIDWTSAETQVKVGVFPNGSIHGSVMMLDTKERLQKTAWSYLADGATPQGEHAFFKNGKFVLHDGQRVKAEGTYEVLPGNRLQVEHSGTKEIFRFEGGNRLVLQEPKDSLPSVMNYVGIWTENYEWLDHTGEMTERDKWTEVFSLPAGTVPATVSQTFIGFSGWTGSEGAVEANLHHLDVTNYDVQMMGEDEADTLGKDNQQWREVLAEEYRYTSQLSQKEAVQRLTKLLQDHVEQYDKEGEKLREDLLHLEARLDILGTDISSFLTMSQSWSYEAQSFDPKLVKEHIGHVRTILTKDKETHDAKLHEVGKAAAALKEKHGASQLGEAGRAKVDSVAEQSRAVEEFAARGSMQTNGLLLVMVLAVSCLGLLFLNRMRYYEKKHYM